MKELEEKILTDDQFVLDEVEKLKVLYKLKHEIRYHHARDEEIDTESVAEHVYGMFVISRYFLPLENPKQSWDQQKINDMILYHDIDEIETGDTIGYLKTTEHHSIEIDATRRVIAQLPESMQPKVTDLLEEYFAQETIESQFVKAVDKFEPLLHVTNESGKKMMLFNGTTLKQHWSIKRKPLAKFTIMTHCTEVITDHMEKEGFFTPE